MKQHEHHATIPFNSNKNIFSHIIQYKVIPPDTQSEPKNFYIYTYLLFSFFFVAVASHGLYRYKRLYLVFCIQFRVQPLLFRIILYSIRILYICSMLSYIAQRNIF